MYEIRGWGVREKFFRIPIIETKTMQKFLYFCI